MGSAETCRDDPLVQALIARQLASDGLLALICACPISLIPNNHAMGRKLTCYPSLRDQLQPPVLNGVTSGWCKMAT